MSIHYSTVNFPLKILAALFALTVFFFSLSIPACAEESTEPAGPTQEEMAMEDLNYRLAVIMKFVSGKMTDEDFAELKNPDARHLLDLDDLIALSGSFFEETGIQTDLSEYENAVSSWEEYMESLSGDTDAAEEFYGQLPLESRAEYLEAAYNVDNAIWSVLRNELGDSLSGMIDLVSDISSHLEKGAETISNAFSLIDKIKVFASVGTDNERYEKRIGLQEIKTRFTLLQQILLVACNAISSGS